MSYLTYNIAYNRGHLDGYTQAYKQIEKHRINNNYELSFLDRFYEANSRLYKAGFIVIEQVYNDLYYAKDIKK